ncbi:signal-regulatory protein beta-1-like isoform X3 [Apteryx mantelli]|uniref:Signal-regulatory protein beta-1-like isoform X3 n=1 Tax=Apteryx mantelli TaxID=2696672 RepID=A0ABM4FG29_9AVES
MALRAAAAAPLLLRLLSLCPAPLAGAGAGAGADGSCQPQQLQEKLQVLVGQTFTLCCTVAGDAAAGAVKWLKPSGGRNETIYAQKGSFPRVTRAANGSNTDFTIHISDARPEDAGTYYCVKLQAGSEERVSCSGAGTAVSVHERGPFPGVAVAAATALLSILLLVFLIAFCVYRRKRGGERGAGRGLPRAPLTPPLLRSAGGSAGSPSTRVPDTETSAPPGQRCGGADADLHYADLQHLPAAPRRAPGPGTAGSEYASIRVAAR